MDADAIELVQRGVLTAMMLGGPLLLVSVVAGVIIAVLQTVTQIQDQTVSYVCKLAAVAVAFAVLLPWLVERMIEFSSELWSHSLLF